MKLKRLLSIFLVSVMLMTVFGPAMPTMAMALESLSSADQNELFQANLAANGEVNTDQTAAPPVYQDGVILLYSFAQLQLVGSDAALTSADSVLPGSGSVMSDNNQTISYALDQTYRIVNDIAVPEGEIWRLPQGFTGAFVSSETEKPLYDEESDTIYICNPYQLETMAMDDADEQPVLSQDAEASTFGSGQLIYPDGDNENYLTYGSSHHYVISKAFAYQAKPITKAAKAPSLRSTNDPLEGRDYEGQVSKQIGGKTYILIGDRQQLDALTANGTTQANVCKPVYTVTEKTVEVWRTNAHLTGDWIWLSDFDGSKDLKNGNGYGTTKEEVLQAKEDFLNNAEIVYPGDADLVGQFAEYPLYDVDANQYHQLVRPAGTATSGNSNRTVYFTVNTTTGLRDISTAHVTASNPTDGSLKYAKDGNYIIFRDIDMTVHYRPNANTTDEWQPLMFTGTMYGAKSANGEKLWNGTAINDATELTATAEENRPVISNVLINKTSQMIVNEYIGVGFFATITNRFDAANIGVSGGTAIVKNIELCNVNVANNTNTAGINTTLVSAVTSGLGTLLGGLLDGLVWVLSFGAANTDLNTTLSNLLNARAKDPTIYSTGAFAGRMVGDVLVEDCIVTHDTEGSIHVSNINDRTGGFVGYMEGMTEYDGLSGALGGLTNLLAGILNVVPGIGLGDLITVLLGNALPLNKLIPTGYESPLVKNCGIIGLSGEIGSTTRNFNGGFVGQQIGSHITESFIRDSNYTVKAKQFGGGFSGIGRDAVIEGLLDNVGIDFSTLIKNIQNIHPQTVLTKDEIVDSTVNVIGGDYLGGFVGDLNNSYSIDCRILKTENASQSVTVTVNGSGNMIGGYAGCATVGWASSLGKDENTTNSLLGTVGSLLTGVLSSDPAAQKQLLTIAGVGPSANDVLYVGHHLIKAKTTLSGAYTIRSNTVLIADDAFRSCTGLTSVTIPDSVTSISDSAFYGCTGLTNVTIGNGVASIGIQTFEYCPGLTSIELPDSVISIGRGAFSGCAGLKRLVIGSGLSSIGIYSFSSCSGLTNITVSSENQTYHCANNCLIKTADKELVLGCKTSVIPSDGSVTSIGDDAFFDCSGLTSVTIPESVKMIGDSAFDMCDNLTDVYYQGTKSDWENISIASYNLPLMNATIHCADGIYDYGIVGYEIDIGTSSNVLDRDVTAYFYDIDTLEAAYSEESLNNQATGVLAV